jgi:hypothetical protein
MPTRARRTAVALLVVLLLPAAAYAQAAITGVVKDASGAVLPGVTVEAASSVLIEKVRSVVTDDTGQYRIVDLRPGTYVVTFTLPGFSTVKRTATCASATSKRPSPSPASRRSSTCRARACRPSSTKMC